MAASRIKALTKLALLLGAPVAFIALLIGAGISIAFVWLASVGIIGALAGAFLHLLGELFVIVNSGRLLRFDQARGY